VAVGYRALNSNNGDLNVAVGSQALFSNKAATANVAVGFQALFSNTDVGGNTAVGFQALGQSSGGSENVALGATAGGALTTGGGNINIGSGVSSTAGASNEIRIGDDQTATFIAGIFGATAPSGAAVSVTAEGKLGTVTSSVRFKDEIKPMDKASEAILALKPVTFRYKKEIDPQRVPQFGLVAEDVEKVNPDLVVRDDKGDIYSVRYDQVNAMLLNEFLKQHRTVQEQQKEIDALKAELKEQRAFIQRVNDKMELDRPAPQTVLNNQ